MTNFLMLAMCFIGVVNMPATRALELTKRSSDLYPNHGTISKDFAVINDGKKDSKQDMKKVTEMKDKDALYVNMLSSLNVSETKNPDFDDVKRNLDLNKKRDIISPLAYIINNHERKLNERHIDNHRTALLNIDRKTNARALEGEKKLTDKAELNHASDRRSGKTSSKRKAKKAVQNPNEATHKSPLNRGSDVIGTAHIVIPPQSMAQYSSSNPFAPIDQLMKMANMLMFKVGMDTMSPYRTQSTHMAFTPNMLMSLRDPNSQHLLFDDNRPNSDYFFNSIEGPQSSEFHTLPTGGNNNGLQSRTVFYAPPLIFKHPISVDEPKQLITIIENALDSVLSNSDNNDDEIDLTCPIHHEKKSIEGDGKCAGDEATGDDNSSGGVIQVCSCRVIKKGHNEMNNQEK